MGGGGGLKTRGAQCKITHLTEGGPLVLFEM